MFNRRKFLTGLTALAAPGALARPGLATPQLLRSSVTDTDHYRISSVWDHDRTPIENTARLQELVDWLSTNRKQLWVDRGSGRPYLITPSTPSWREFGPATLPASRAITLRHNDFHLVGDGGRIVMVAMPGGPPPGKCYAFATEQNMEIGAIRNVTVEGSPYDWDSSISNGPDGLRSNYMLGLCGVRGIAIRNVLVANSARSKRGAFAAIYNSADLQVTDLELQYLQQGFNLNYVEDILFRGIKARVFSEVVDANFPIARAIFENLDGDNLGSPRGESQFLDLVGKDIRVSGLRVRNQTGNAIAAYAKGKSWPSYARHVEMGETLNPAPIGIENITIENIQAEEAGLTAGYPLVSMGNRRDERVESVGGVVDGVTHAPLPVARNLTLRHVRGRRTSGVAIYEGHDVRVEDVVLEDCYGGAASEFFAFRAGQQTRGPNVRRISQFSGVLRNIEIRGARYGGIFIDGPGEVTTENLHSEGWGSAGEPAPSRGQPIEGFHVAHLGDKPGTFRFAGYTALNTNDIRGPSLRFSGLGGSAAKPIENSGGHRLTGLQPLVLDGGPNDARQLASVEEFHLGPLTLGDPDRPLDVPLRALGSGRKALVIHAEVAFQGSLRFEASAAPDFALVRRRSDRTSMMLARFAPIPAAARIAQSAMRLQPPRARASTEDGILSGGEQLVLTVSGGRITIPGLTVRLWRFEWLST